MLHPFLGTNFLDTNFVATPFFFSLVGTHDSLMTATIDNTISQVFYTPIYKNYKASIVIDLARPQVTTSFRSHTRTRTSMARGMQAVGIGHIVRIGHIRGFKAIWLG